MELRISRILGTEFCLALRVVQVLTAFEQIKVAFDNIYTSQSQDEPLQRLPYHWKRPMQGLTRTTKPPPQGTNA